MQPAITIAITVLMGLVPVTFSIRLAAAARELNFSPGRRARVVIVTFVLLAGWLGLVIWAALSGFFQTPLPHVFGIPVTHVGYLLFGPVILGLLVIALSPTTRALFDTWQPQRLMFIETARIIGAVFLVRYFTGAMAAGFALPAGIGDVIIGLTAPVMAYLVATRGDKVRGFAIAWNIVGILELVNAFASGYLTYAARIVPTSQPASGGGDLTRFPLVLIPGYGVPLMILVHIIALRLLLKKPQVVQQLSTA